MKQIIRKISFIILFTGSACFAQAAGESRIGLYSEKNNRTTETVSVKESVGLYTTEAPSTDGILRAGGNEGDGDGNPNKVPAKDSLLLVLVVAAGYLFWKKKKNQGVY
ncbi:MAG: hypothetical protein LBN18_00625 [Dysgonamonadaceae bacterium]|jgi:hypothetical protein|nr:hypothetical protein [Dysgonamonadaceae bacterium]